MTQADQRGTVGADETYCFIIHDHVPYCFEVNAILALPRGFRYRNRFATSWVEPNLRDDIGKLVGRRVLLVLRDQNRNHLIPFRWANIVLAERSGNMFYFEYLVDELIAYPTGTDGVNDQISSTTREFGLYHTWLPGRAGESLNTREPSVFASRAGANLPTAESDSASEWGATVNAVSTPTVFEGSEFLKVLGIRTLDGKSAEVVDESFILHPDTVYQIRVLQNIPQPGAGNVEPHEIQLHSFGDHLVKLKPSQRAVGKYDMLNFVVKTRALAPNERSAIEIPVTPTRNYAEYAPSPLYMPVRIGPRSRWAVGGWVLALLVSLLLIFRPGLTGQDETTVRNIATVIFVLLVSGWQRTSGALFPILPWTSK